MTATLFDQISKIQAGETLGPITLGYSEFPRSAGWELKCIIVGQTGKDCDVAATDGPDADSFTLSIPATITAAFVGGRKSFVIEAAHTTDGTYIAERGAILILNNPRVATAEMTILSNIRAVKAGLATDGQRMTSLEGMQLIYMTPDQLDGWEAKYIKIVNAQIGRAGGNGGVYAIKMRTPQDNRYAAPWYGPYPPPGGGR
ncbi:MAG: hypothetical protein ACOYOU_03310 [Kiritimatiellia bacterium]